MSYCQNRKDALAHVNKVRGVESSLRGNDMVALIIIIRKLCCANITLWRVKIITQRWYFDSFANELLIKYCMIDNKITIIVIFLFYLTVNAVY